MSTKFWRGVSETVLADTAFSPLGPVARPPAATLLMIACAFALTAEFWAELADAFFELPHALSTAPTSNTANGALILAMR